MRKIHVRPRRGGNATYYDMKPDDLEFVKQQLLSLIIEVAERTISTDHLDKNLVDIWTANGAQLGFSPKYHKQNNIASVVGGILKNLKNGTRDLTDKNCDKIQQIFEMIKNGIDQDLFPNIKIESVQFTTESNLPDRTLNPMLFA